MLAFLSVSMDSCACACVSQCLYGLLGLRLCFSVYVWTLGLMLCDFPTVLFDVNLIVNTPEGCLSLFLSIVFFV